MPGEAKSAESALIARLEEFFLSPEVTTAVGDFMQNNVERLQWVAAEDVQPIGNHAVFMEYQTLVETTMEAFVKAEGISLEEVAVACLSMKAADGGASTSIDYVIAATEYSSFMELMTDYAALVGLIIQGEDSDEDEEETAAAGADADVSESKRESNSKTSD